MIPMEWVHRNEKALLPEQVKRLEPGTKVTILGADRYGECVRTECTVAQSGKKKVLVTRDRATWEKKVLPITAQDSRLYVVEKGG